MIENRSKSVAYNLGFQDNAVLYSLLILFFLLGAISMIIWNKQELFISLNSLHSPFLDALFPILTYLGDGILYIPLAIILLFISFGRTLDFAISAGISAIFVQLGKRVFFADMKRPFAALGEETIHMIDGVQLHMARSFPSGHSTSAMLMFFYLAIISPSRILKFVFLMLGFIGGYSRIYLSQHFFSDVYAGFAIAVFSVLFITILRNRIGKPNWYDKKFKANLF